MTDTLTEFNPKAAGFRPATPITRRRRAPSAKNDPKPQFADAVLFTFLQARPLEVEVYKKTRESVPDVVRALKRAQRWIMRNQPVPGRKLDIRIQISVEPVKVPVTDDEGQLVRDPDTGEVVQRDHPRKSVVKFYAHEPYLLGRRIKMVQEKDGQPAPDPAPVAQIAAQRRKRTTAGTRSTFRSALYDPLVGSVITPARLAVCPGSGEFLRCRARRLPGSYHSDRFSPRRGVFWQKGGAVECYREYIETGDGVLTIRMCHDFPAIAPTGDNQVVIFDPEVAAAMTAEEWGHQDMPTDKWAIPPDEYFLQA